MKYITMLVMFVCNDQYGCQTITHPLPGMTQLQCMMTSQQMSADWAASLDGLARVHSFKCTIISTEQASKGHG